MTTHLDTGRDTEKARAYRLASRPAELLMLARATRRQLAQMSSQDLGVWSEGLRLALRRERAKSVGRHWSYDLNRHSALKQARDRIRSELATRTNGIRPE